MRWSKSSIHFKNVIFVIYLFHHKNHKIFNIEKAFILK